MASVPPAIPVSTTQQVRWHTLSTFLNEWFYKPDLQALAIAMAVARVQAYRHCLPVWLFVVGPASTGKTSIVIEALREFPLAYDIGELTPNTFLTGKRGAKSLLLDGGSDHLFLFKDFTTFLSKRPEDRAAIAAQLREIYDGRFSKNTGESGRQPWTGRVTVVAACTHAIEQHWALHRNLGERFLTVRWPEDDPMGQAEAAERQLDHAEEIKVTIHSLTRQFLEPILPSVPARIHRLPEPAIRALASLVARCRVHVSRSENYEHVIEVFPPEGPSRIVQGITALLTAHAELMGLAEPDMAVARRVAFDSIPWRRGEVLAAMPRTDASVGLDQLMDGTTLPLRTLKRTLEDMEASHIIESVGSSDLARYVIKPNIIRWMEAGGFVNP